MFCALLLVALSIDILIFGFKSLPLFKQLINITQYQTNNGNNNTIFRHNANSIVPIAGWMNTDYIWNKINISQQCILNNHRTYAFSASMGNTTNTTQSPMSTLSTLPNNSTFSKCGLNKQIILWTGHHKTGSSAFNLFNKYIVSYCHNNLNQTMQYKLIKKKYKIQWMNFNLINIKHLLNKLILNNQIQNLKQLKNNNNNIKNSSSDNNNEKKVLFCQFNT